MIRFLIPISIALLGVSSGARAAERGTIEENVAVRRGHLPVLLEPSRRGIDCSWESLSPADVILREEGERVRVTAIGPRPRPRIHALLIDASQSMTDRLAATRQAALDYVDALPADDATLVLSFDESMVLRAPLGAGRDRVRQAIRSLRPGNATALWDSLYQLMSDLATVRGDKVVVVLTDGEDSHSVDVTGDRVFELADGLPDVAVFPIGVRLPSAIRGGVPMARGRLGEIARRTGGRFFETRTAEGLRPAFRAILDRLDRRVFVSFVPRGPDEGRIRRLKVRAVRGSPCRMTALGPAHPDGVRRAAPAVVATSPGPHAGTGRDPSPDCGVHRAGARVTHRFPVGPSGPAGGSGFLEALDGREALVGRVLDFTMERGPLFTAKSIRGGKPRMTLDRAPAFEMRRVVVPTPPLEVLRRELTGPEELLYFMLDLDLCLPGDAADPSHPRPETFVHGRTFLRIRRPLSHALFEAYPDYRAWALDGIDRVVEARFAELASRLPVALRLPPDRAAGLRRGLRAQETDPELGSLPALLSEWLADLDAREAALGLERAAVNRLLGAADALDDRDGEEVVRRVSTSWGKLRRWFPPATRGRIVTPMIPVYDPAREVVGYYRFVLPRPSVRGGHGDALPTAPLGLITVERLLRDPAVADVLRGVRVVSVGHSDVRRREVSRQRCPPGRVAPRGPDVKVVLELAGPGDRAPTASLTAYFDDGATRPSCLRVAGEGRSPTAAALEVALASSDLPLDD